MSKWGDLSDEQREEYISQDFVPRTWREMLGSEIGPFLYRDISDRTNFSHFSNCDTYMPEDSPLLNIVDPIEMECLRLFYMEKKTRREIADSISLQYFSGGKLISTRKLTVPTVRNKLQSGRAALKSAVGGNWEKFLSRCKQINKLDN